MKNLNKEIVNKTYSKIKVMQFGEGNFLRAFVDWIIQKMNDSKQYDGHVVVVQPLAFGRVKELEEQDEYDDPWTELSDWCRNYKVDLNELYKYIKYCD